jgi:predicted permease
MNWLRELFSRCTAFMRGKKLDDDLDHELESHIDLAIEENVRRGMTREQAGSAALRMFGGVTQVKESYRAQRGVPFFISLGRDLRYGLRRLRSSPGFTLVAIMTLALGIGANTAIFTLVQGILLRSLPVADPSRLVRIGDATTCCYYDGFEGQDGDFDLFSYDLYQQFKQAAPEFEQLAAVQAGGGGYTVMQYGSAPARPLRSEFVSGNYFATLGVSAYAGRPFGESDDRTGAPPVLVLSYQTWQTEFARDPAIVGSILYIQKHPFTVAGIAPPGFFGDRVASIPPDMWLPLSAEIELEGANAAVSQRQTAWLYALGRLRTGVDQAALQSKLSGVLRQWMRQFPDFTRSDEAAAIPRQHVVLSAAGGGIQKLQKQTGASLRLLMILSSVVLLISCANIANLLLARSTAHRTAMAVRMALGAARPRIIRQILTESVLLSVLGGIAGLAVAWVGSRAILALAFPEAHNMPVQTHPSWPVLGFAFLVSLLTGIVFGTAPAWTASHAQPAEVLRGANVASRDRGSLAQHLLVIVQFAMSIVLLTGTFLMTKSLANLEHQNFGIETAGRYTFGIDLQGAGYTLDRLPEFYREVEDRLGAIPGVANVSFVRYVPLGGNQWGTCVILKGQPNQGIGDKCFSDWNRASAQFLDTMGVPIVHGRGFTAQDTATSVPVVLVNQAFAKKFFPGQDPIGQHFGTDGAQYSGAFEIVGVFRDFVLSNPRAEARTLFLRPSTQRFTAYKESATDAAEKSSMFLDHVIINVSRPVPDLETLVRKTIAGIDPGLPVFHFTPYDAVVADNFNQERLIARLTSAFGLLALTLACIGLYGVMSYFVARRASEIGIRMAIGASRSLIVRMVLRGALVQLIVGLALGVPASLFLGRLMTSLLFHVSGSDPLALAGASAVLTACAAVASLVPAMRAASLDPVRALRTE